MNSGDSMIQNEIQNDYISNFIKRIDKGPFAYLKDSDSTNDSAFITKMCKVEAGKRCDTLFGLDWITFGKDLIDIYRGAIEQAWIDTSQTISALNKNPDEWVGMRNEIAEVFRDYFEGSPKQTAKEFDGWYYLFLYNSIMNHFHLTFGQKQRIVNMAFMYLYCCRDYSSTKRDYFNYCHMPLDSNTIRWYNNIIDCKSKWTNNEKIDGKLWCKLDKPTYYKLAKRIKEEIGEKGVLLKSFYIIDTMKAISILTDATKCIDKINTIVVDEPLLNDKEILESLKKSAMKELIQKKEAIKKLVD